MTDVPGPAGPQPAQDGPRRRKALRPLAAVLAAVLAGVGIGEVILHTAYQDGAVRDAAAAPVTAAPSPSYGAWSNGNHFGSLHDLMLPVPGDYRPGPDSGELGNDAVLTAAQLSARLQQQLKSLPADRRKRVGDAWQSLRLRAGGIRTYRAVDGTFMAEMVLNQFNQRAVKALTALDAAYIDGSGAFRRGPGVPGYPDARCVLPPLQPSAQIDYMDCFAAVGDLLVTMRVAGAMPFDQGKERAAQLLKAQLDRLRIPGAVV